MADRTDVKIWVGAYKAALKDVEKLAAQSLILTPTLKRILKDLKGDAETIAITKPAQRRTEVAKNAD